MLNSLDDLALSAAPNLCKQHWSWEPIIQSIVNGASSCSLQHLNFDNEVIASAVTAAVAAEAKVQKTVYTALSNYFLKTPLRPTLIKRCSKYLSTDLFPASSFAQVD